MEHVLMILAKEKLPFAIEEVIIFTQISMNYEYDHSFFESFHDSTEDLRRIVNDSDDDYLSRSKQNSESGILFDLGLEEQDDHYREEIEAENIYLNKGKETGSTRQSETYVENDEVYDQSSSDNFQFTIFDSCVDIEVKQPPKPKAKRTQRVIQMSSQKLWNNSNAKNCPGETSNLSKSVFTETFNLLKAKSKQFKSDPKAFEAILEYKQGNGALASYKDLFSHQVIKRSCLEHYESSEFIMNVMRSNKDFDSKIILIKFLKAVRANAIKEVKNWKERA